jgi:hypothetical protein
MNDALWKRLLAQIRDGLVVPVLGPRLLVEPDGQTSLLAGIAEGLLASHDLEVHPGSLPPFRELNEAYARLKANVPSLNLDDIYADVHELLQPPGAAGKTPPPLPIRQLAEITDFRLFVSLTPDDGLARSLRSHRGVNEIVHSLELPSGESGDLSPAWGDHSEDANVLYLFGKSRPARTYALHDEDVLEYAHSLLTRASKVPARFLDELQGRSLLLIGCNFPDWLSRFFLRLTNGGRLSADGRQRKWVVEPLGAEESLTCFLRSHSKQTELTSTMSPPEFVAELHRRWTEGRVTDSPALQANGHSTRGTVFFVSYSRAADGPKAHALVEQLRGLGADAADVWFDGHTIEPGNDFRARIADGIQTCRYFLPLVSAAADRTEQGEVFAEWDRATARLPSMNRDFLLPIIVDPEFDLGRCASKLVRLWRDKAVDFAQAPGGVPDERLKKRLVDLIREARRLGDPHSLAA